jgi:hypothetical protein
VFVEALVIFGLGFTAFVAFTGFVRARRRFISGATQAPPDPAFDPAEIQAFLDARMITPGERDRLITVVQKQRARRDAETLPPGPVGFPVVPIHQPAVESGERFPRPSALPDGQETGRVPPVRKKLV